MSNLSACELLPFGTLDRFAHLRANSEWIRQQLSQRPQFVFVWKGCNLFGTGLKKGPLFLEIPDSARILNPIFLGVRPGGLSLFAADLSSQSSEEDALAFLTLNSGLARFVPLREFDGSLSAEER